MRLRCDLRIALFALLVVAAPAREAISTPDDLMAVALRSELALPGATTAGSGARPSSHRRASEQSTLEALYAGRAYRPLWSLGGALTPQAQQLIRLLAGAGDYGLQPLDYGADSLQHPPAAASLRPAQDWAHYDLQLSAAALQFITNVHGGRIEPRTAGFELPANYDGPDYSAAIEQLATRDDAEAVISALEPNYLHYRLLREALPRYRELASKPGLNDLPPLPRSKVTAGQTYVGAAALRRLLFALGDFSSASLNDAPVIDRPLSDALKRFQGRHGLDADGVLGRGTYAALTVPLTQRVRQIELTLERWRWLPPIRGRTLIVNIPAFRLFGFSTAQDLENGMLRMNVIVGRQYRRTQTPVFMAQMRDVVFRPYWDVPRSITLHEILPALQRNPSYLQSQHMELVRGQTDASPVEPPTAENLEALALGQLRLRQRPGPDNALGLVKFLLPNEHDVYLHDTPSVQLFGQAQRAFSHGCIRVGNPIALAEFALADNPGAWTREKIQAAMRDGPNQRVPLAQPIEVLILYGTAIAAEDGTLHFYGDIYGQDRKLESLLGLKPPLASSAEPLP